MIPFEEYFYFTISDALFVGNENNGDDYWSLYQAMKDVYPENAIAVVNETFDTYLEKAINQSPEPVYSSGVGMESLASFLLNQSMTLSSEMVDDLLDNVGFFGCILNPQEPCLTSIEFMHTIPRDLNDLANTAVPR